MWLWSECEHLLFGKTAASVVLRDAIQTLSRRSLLSDDHTVSRYTRKCYFFHAHNQSTAFPAPILMKLKKRWTALCEDLLYRISHILDNKCGKQGQTIMYVPYVQYGCQSCTERPRNM